MNIASYLMTTRRLSQTGLHAGEEGKDYLLYPNPRQGLGSRFLHRVAELRSYFSVLCRSITRFQVQSPYTG